MNRYTLTRHLWRSSGLVVLWAGMLVLSLLVTGIVSLFKDITISGWSAWVYISPWYMLGMGIYVTAVHLPMYIEHGVTRRRCMPQALLFGLLLVTVGAALITLGFGIERALYAVVDWPQTLGESDDGLFTAADQYGRIFLGFWLGFAIFLAVGAAIGAAFYRKAWGGLGGVLVIVLGLGLISPAGLAGAASFPTSRVVEAVAGQPSIALVVVSCVVAAVAATGLTWGLVRDLPIRSSGN
ncbi:hypothetical protein HLB23_25665 [Nocardia uniformis]|uniref:Uncharacterized protein n=1 Tax=Nocardia uniformis TaxID=53432 RepID=A0A849C396_9NOCA|nr:hypothetical protein [Nocardia uniformis]NNH73203.1 hypothetical protein [Nocardia uniformis]